MPLNEGLRYRKLLSINAITVILLLIALLNEAACNGAAFNITRVFNHGDVFNTLMDDSKCDPKNCAVYRAVSLRSSPCYCQCKPEKPAFLQHLKRCEDSLDGCKMVDFVIYNHNQIHDTQQIPTVFLPLKGSIVNPTAVLDWSSVGIRVAPDGSIPCTIQAIGYLLQKDGFTPVENAASLFALSMDSGKTHLQWLGNKQDQIQLSGKVIQVSLKCEPNANADVCVAFRVVGKDVPLSAVALASVNHDNPSTERSNQLGLIVGIVCGVLLAVTLICVAIFWTVCWRQQKERLARKIQLHVMYQQRLQQQNGGVFQHFGQAFNPMHEAAVRSAIEMLQSYSVNSAAPNFNPFVDPQCWAQAEIQRQQQGYRHPSSDGRSHDQLPPPPPYPHVVKKRLHFSPEFFDPELMANPPPVAEEFLYELRRMIDVAKGRIRSRRYLPNLDEIPEEDHAAASSRKTSFSTRIPAVIPIHDYDLNAAVQPFSARHVQTSNLDFIREDSAESPRSSSGDESHDSSVTADRSSSESSGKASSKDSGYSEEDGNKVAHWLSRLPPCIEIDESAAPAAAFSPTALTSQLGPPSVGHQNQHYFNELQEQQTASSQFCQQAPCFNNEFCHPQPKRKSSLNENLLTHHQQHMFDPMVLANHLLRSYSIPVDPEWWLRNQPQQSCRGNDLVAPGDKAGYSQSCSGTLPKTLSPDDLMLLSRQNSCNCCRQHKNDLCRLLQHNNEMCKHLPYGQSMPRFKQLVRPPLASDLFLSNSSSQSAMPTDNNSQFQYNNAHNV